MYMNKLIFKIQNRGAALQEKTVEINYSLDQPLFDIPVDVYTVYIIFK